MLAANWSTSRAQDLPLLNSLSHSASAHRAELTGPGAASRAVRGRASNSANNMGQDNASTADCMGNYLSPEAAACLEKLPFKDCTLVLKDARISCHRLELTKVSEVLGWAPLNYAAILRAYRMLATSACRGLPQAPQWLFSCSAAPRGTSMHPPIRGWSAWHHLCWSSKVGISDTLCLDARAGACCRTWPLRLRCRCQRRAWPQLPQYWDWPMVRKCIAP